MKVTIDNCTVAIPTVTLNIAYQQGQIASEQAYDRSDNPYTTGIFHEWWDGGYCDSFDELIGAHLIGRPDK